MTPNRWQWRDVARSVRTVTLVAFLVLGVLRFCSSHAAETGFEVSMGMYCGGVEHHFSSAEEACAAAVTAPSRNCPPTANYDSGEVDFDGGPPSGAVHCRLHFGSSADDISDGTWTACADPDDPICGNPTPIFPDHCSGLSSEGVGDQFTSSVYPGGGSGGSYCNPISGCKMTVVRSVAIDGTAVYQIKHTEDDCAGDEPSSEDAPLEDGESCVTGSGAEFCLSQQGENCGYVNDSFTCLPQVEDDGCKVFGDSSRVCGPQAPTPPVPDNGTPGHPATADEQIVSTVNGEPTTLDFFSSSTVGDSARPPGTTGDNPFEGGDDGSGTETGSGGGDGDGEEGGECPEGATCDGSLPDGGELEEVCTFQECTQAFIDRVRNSPLVDSVASVGDSWPDGTCPDWGFDLWDEEMSFSTAVCSFWESIGSVLGGIMLIVFAWLGTRIVLSA